MRYEIALETVEKLMETAFPDAGDVMDEMIGAEGTGLTNM